MPKIYGEWSETLQFQTAEESPPSPGSVENLTAIADGHSAIDLSWNSADYADTYTIAKLVVSTGELSFITGVADTSYRDTNVQPDSEYGYQVKAVNEYGESPYSNDVYAQTDSEPAPDPTSGFSIWGGPDAIWGGPLTGWGGDPTYKGSWTSAPIPIGQLRVVKTSVITWQATVPTGTGLQIFTSTDGGSTWLRAINGLTVPQLVAGMPVDNVELLVHVRMTSDTIDVSPSLESITLEMEPGNIVELVPLILGGITSVEISDTKEGMNIRIAGSDRSRRIQRNRLISNYTVEPGTNYSQAIQDLIEDRLPGTTFDFETTTFVTPTLVFGSSGDQPGGDPWKYITEMAEAIGMEVFFDLETCILRPIPNVDPDPNVYDWEYSEGPLSMVLYVNKRYDDEDTRNIIVVSGESVNEDVDELITGYAEDNDPNSATYIGDPPDGIGRVPGFFRSAYVRSEEQADELAESILKDRIGRTQSGRIISIVNPAHDVRDVIKVIRSPSKISERHVIESMTIPLGAEESMNVTLKDRKV